MMPVITFSLVTFSVGQGKGIACEIRHGRDVPPVAPTHYIRWGWRRPRPPIIPERCRWPTPPSETFAGRITRQSDQYSLAVSYYQLRLVRLPFTGTLQEMHLHAPHLPTTLIVPFVGSW